MKRSSWARFLQPIIRTWLTGALSLLAIPGYILYSILWMIRFMQTSRRAAVVAFSGLLLALAFSVYHLFLPIGPCTEEITLIIPKGSSTSLVADSLKAHKVVTSRTALLLWLRFKGYAHRIQAGKIVLLKGEGVLRASPKLLKAESIDLVITIPEGLTLWQTASKIAEVLRIDTTQFVALCGDSAFIRQTVCEAVSLEGYLFPNTYRFPENATPVEIIKKMVDQFHKTYASLTLHQEIAGKFSKHEIVTLASIVEKEATLGSERARIAGVFHNRLRQGYPLGADPTVRYILKKFNGPLRVSELNIDSRYNTRKYAGLPPGPICSPGRLALQATAQPEKTRELYFVAKWDGSGEHDFSLTNEEHTRKKLQIRHENESRIRREKRKR